MPLHRQRFDTFEEWVSSATRFLTFHERYNEGAGWSEPNPFRAVCYDARGRLCRRDRDFMRARDEDAFPVYWIWPDQVGKRLLKEAETVPATQVGDFRQQIVDTMRDITAQRPVSGCAAPLLLTLDRLLRRFDDHFRKDEEE